MAWQYLALAGFQIAQGLQQAETIKTQGAISQDIAKLNAKYAMLDAYKAEQAGYTQAARYQSVIDKVVADQEAAYIAQDVDTTFGTAADVVKETELVGYLNQLDMINQGHAKALGYQREARNTRFEARMNQVQTNLQASSTQNAALLNAASTASGYFKK
jgi:hypothetical protein